MGKLTCLHDAVKADDVLELQAMVQQGSRIDDTDNRHSFSPLHWAAQYGSLECMHWLLWHRADVMATTPERWTASHIAAIRGNNLCMQALAASHADLNAVDCRGRTPAMLAASHGNSYTLQSILRKGVDIAAKDKYGWSAVHGAAYHGRVGCLQVLNKWGANLMEIDESGNTPAHLAAAEGHLHCLKLIVSCCPSVDGVIHAHNDQGELPIDLAQDYFKQDCVDYLTGIDFDCRHPETGENLAFPAHVASYKGDLSYLETLITTGVVSINERDGRGSTPAHKAAGNGKVDVLRWLQDQGANMSLLNSNGETPKDVARRFCKLACVHLLGGDDLEVEQQQIEDETAIVDQSSSERDHYGAKQAEAKSRALQKVKELKRLYETSQLNYQQLGGVLKEDEKEVALEKEQERQRNELDAQLSYEREKREELEAQLDILRAKVHTLNVQLEDTKQQLMMAHATMLQSCSPQPPKGKPRAKSSKPRPREQGVFLVRKSSFS